MLVAGTGCLDGRRRAGPACRSWRHDILTSRHGLREAGFTLIEMIVVLVVLALAGSIVLARGPMHSATLDLRAAGRVVAADMRTTRDRAIATDRDLVFTTDPAHRDYGMKDGPRHGLSGPVVLDGPAVPIVFHPDGSASGGLVTLSENDRRVTILVDWLTGRVSMR